MPNDKEFELDDLESFSFDDLSLDDAPPAPSGDDPLGVWVKGTPEDVDPQNEGSDLDSLDTHIPDFSVEDSLSEEDFLSSEELANLDVDFVTVDEPLTGESPLDDDIPLNDELSLDVEVPDDDLAGFEVPQAALSSDSGPPSTFDEISLDDFVNFDDVSTDEVPGTKPEASPEATFGDDDLNEEFLDIDIDIEDDINDEELEIIEGAQPKPTPPAEEVSESRIAAEEIDLSEFGDFEVVDPLGADSGDLADDLPEVKDLPDDFNLEEEALGEGSFEDTVLEDALPPLDDAPQPALNLEPDDHTDLDHILALEEDLTSGIRAPEPVAAPAAKAPEQDLAALILGKIEQELSSLKQEISALKKEVTDLRTAPPAMPEPVAQGGSDETEAAKPLHGFFDEEDDETIALTGDELDNILSTAEISEGEEAGLSLDEDLLGLDAEGNLVEPATALSEPEEGPVNDEEFLAGTALDLNEPDPFESLASDPDETVLGVPESIELEESLPEELDIGETEDLLALGTSDLEIEPLPEGLLGGPAEPLEIPFDEDFDLEFSEPSSPPADEPAEVPEEPLDEAIEIPAPSSTPGWTEPEPEVWPAASSPPPAPAPAAPIPSADQGSLSPGLKDELRSVLSYMDKLLASLPDEKIQEFAESEHFEVYKRLFEELGLIE